MNFVNVFLLVVVFVVGVYSNCGCLKCNPHYHVCETHGTPIKIIYRNAQQCGCPSRIPYSIQIPKIPPVAPCVRGCYKYEIKVPKITEVHYSCPRAHKLGYQVQVPIAPKPRENYLIGLFAKTDRIVLPEIESKDCEPVEEQIDCRCGCQRYSQNFARPPRISLKKIRLNAKTNSKGPPPNFLNPRKLKILSPSLNQDLLIFWKPKNFNSNVDKEGFDRSKSFVRVDLGKLTSLGDFPSRRNLQNMEIIEHLSRQPPNSPKRPFRVTGIKNETVIFVDPSGSKVSSWKSIRQISEIRFPSLLEHQTRPKRAANYHLQNHRLKPQSARRFTSNQSRKPNVLQLLEDLKTKQHQQRGSISVARQPLPFEKKKSAALKRLQHLTLKKRNNAMSFPYRRNSKQFLRPGKGSRPLFDPPEVQLPDYEQNRYGTELDGSSNRAPWWQNNEQFQGLPWLVETQDGDGVGDSGRFSDGKPKKRATFLERLLNRHKRHVKVKDESILPFFTADENEEKPQARTDPFLEPFNFEHIFHHTPILHLLNAPVRYLNHLHRLKSQVTPVVGTIPRVIRVSRQYLKDFLKELARNALGFGTNFLGDFSKFKRTHKLVKRRRKRSAGQFEFVGARNLVDGRTELVEANQEHTTREATPGNEENARFLEDVRDSHVSPLRFLASSSNHSNERFLRDSGLFGRKKDSTKEEGNGKRRSDRNFRGGSLTLSQTVQSQSGEGKLIEEENIFIRRKRQIEADDQEGLDTATFDQPSFHNFENSGLPHGFEDFPSDFGVEQGHGVEQNFQNVHETRQEFQNGDEIELRPVSGHAEGQEDFQNVQEFDQDAPSGFSFGQNFQDAQQFSYNSPSALEVDHEDFQNVQGLPSAQDFQNLQGFQIVDQAGLENVQESGQDFQNVQQSVQNSPPRGFDAVEGFQNVHNVEQYLPSFHGGGQNFQNVQNLPGSQDANHAITQTNQDGFRNLHEATRDSPSGLEWSPHFQNLPSDQETEANHQIEAHPDFQQHFPAHLGEFSFQPSENDRFFDGSETNNQNFALEPENTRSNSTISQKSRAHQQIIKDFLKRSQNLRKHLRKFYWKPKSADETVRKTRAEGEETAFTTEQPNSDRENGTQTSTAVKRNKRGIEEVTTIFDDLLGDMLKLFFVNSRKTAARNATARNSDSDDRRPRTGAIETEIEEAKRVVESSAASASIETQTIREEMLQILQDVETSLKSNSSDDPCSISEQLSALQILKSKLASSWYQFSAGKLPEDKEQIQTMLKSVLDAKRKVLSEIITKLAGKRDRFTSCAWIKALVRLQKLHCVIKKIKDKLKDETVEFESVKPYIEVLEGLNFSVSEESGLDTSEGAKVKRQIELLKNLKRILSGGDSKIIKEEAKLLWEIRNIEKLQRESIKEIKSKISQGLRIRRELKILFDLHKRVEECEEKQSGLIK